MRFPDSADPERVDDDGIDGEQWDRIWNAAAAAQARDPTWLSVALREFQDDPRTRRPEVLERVAIYASFILFWLLRGRIGPDPNRAGVDTLVDEIFPSIHVLLTNSKDDLTWVLRGAAALNDPNTPRRPNMLPVILAAIGLLADEIDGQKAEARDLLARMNMGRIRRKFGFDLSASD